VVGRKKTKAGRISFKLGIPKRKTRRKHLSRPGLKAALISAAVLCVVAAIGFGFVLLDKYVARRAPVSRAALVPKLLDVPEWVSERLKEKVVVTAQMDTTGAYLGADTARTIQQNIKSAIVWLDEVRVQVTNENILISANWRKPLVLVKAGDRTVYLDADMVVLDYLEMPKLPIVKIKGLLFETPLPQPGRVWKSNDAAAAVALADRLDRMDKSVAGDKPLLCEIERIDVSNFNGREDERSAHIVLYTKDNTEIIWGAELGTWQRYLEATDEEKLTNLYAYYKEHGSLLGGAKYINLQYSQTRVSLPVDKY